MSAPALIRAIHKLCTVSRIDMLFKIHTDEPKTESAFRFQTKGCNLPILSSRFPEKLADPDPVVPPDKREWTVLPDHASVRG